MWEKGKCRFLRNETNSSNPLFYTTVSRSSKTHQAHLQSQTRSREILFPRHTLLTKLNDVGTIRIFLSRGKSTGKQGMRAPLSTVKRRNMKNDLLRAVNFRKDCRSSMEYLPAKRTDKLRQIVFIRGCIVSITRPHAKSKRRKRRQCLKLDIAY